MILKKFNKIKSGGDPLKNYHMGVVLNNFCKLDHSFGLKTRKQGQNLI